ncbi:MAG TPA: hypothetical protein VFE98_04440 [Candidatus Bathyarchaeia archaeon]|nr:hypothetical protein [Candidatus Bathyarchaeia archaeon]
MKIETSLSNQKLAGDLWHLDFRKSCVCISRHAIPGGVDNFMTHVALTQERSATEIRRLVKEDEKTKLDGGTTSVTLSLTNNFEFMIKDFEIQHTLPPIDKLELVSATRIGVRDKSIELDTKDFVIRYDVPLKDCNNFAGIKKAQPLLVGTVDLEPGQTIVEFQFVQSQVQPTLESGSQTTGQVMQ